MRKNVLESHDKANASKVLGMLSSSMQEEVKQDRSSSVFNVSNCCIDDSKQPVKSISISILIMNKAISLYAMLQENF